MEEKGILKISLMIVVVLIVVIIIGLGIYFFFRTGNQIEYITEVCYYSGTSASIKNAFVSSYNELEKYVEQFGTITTIGKENVLSLFDNNYFENYTLAIEAHDASSTNDCYAIDNVTLSGTEANINITHTIDSYGGDLAPTVEFTFITLDKNITNAKFNIKTKKVNNNTRDIERDDKPIIYLYPTEDTKVFVKLQYKDNITVSYPKYVDGWNVLARKDGSLVDILTNKNLYALYYESKNVLDFKIENDGFVVKGENTIEFLEEKLAILGLNERETEEFIIYWLPKLAANKYNYIRFATAEEINENMPLEINPNPDTVIRVLMTFKGLEKPINVQEQQLEMRNRTGFVIVEWGGTEIK